MRSSPEPPWNSLYGLTMEVRIRALDALAIKLPARVVAKRRGIAMATDADNPIAVLPAALHGAIGKALFRQTCTGRDPESNECGRCSGMCGYAELFHSPLRLKAPALRLQFPPMTQLPMVLSGEDSITFGITIAGRATPAAPEILRVLEWMSGKATLGDPGMFGQSERQGLEILDVRTTPLRLRRERAPTRVRLDFSSPWVDRREHLAPFARLFLGIEARVSYGLDHHYGEGAWRAHPVLRPVEPQVEAICVEAVPESWAGRFDPFRSRPARRAIISGTRLHFVLEGNLQPYWPLLRLGEWFGVGRDTDLGCGTYRLHSPRF